MPQNPGKSPEIPLDQFSGLVTYMDPTALPAGASPNCSDMTFLPGGCSSRPCLQKVFAIHIYPNTTMVWGQSFRDPVGTWRNLYLYSNGGVTIEFPISNPGVEAALLDNNGNPVFVPTGSYMKAITAFGRFYMAPSNGLQGSDIPLQYDGTYLDRVTQDGPGSCANIVSLPLPSVPLVASGAGISLTVVSITTSGLVEYQVPDGMGGTTTISIYTTLTVLLSSGGLSLTQGQNVEFSGNSYGGFNSIPTYLSQIISDNEIICGGGFTSYETGAGGSLTTTGGVTLIRTNNAVAATTALNPQLQPGFQVLIAGVPATSVGGGISSIVIDNENTSGIATITTSAPHGLQPGNNVSIAGVEAAEIASSTDSFSCTSEIGTVVMASPTAALTPGAFVTLASFANAAFNGLVQVLSVTATNAPGDTFTFSMNGQSNIAPSTGGSGTVSINWPIPATATPTFFEVQSAPTPTTFQVAINYADGTWNTGTVTFQWDGTFYVLTTPAPTMVSTDTLSSAVTTTTMTTVDLTSGSGFANGDTIQIDNEQMVIVSGGGTGTITVTRGANNTTPATHLIHAAVYLVTFNFTYQQYGPNASTTNVGTATPYGQAAPGRKQMQVLFLRRSGTITVPSPPVKFVANGGQYYQVTNIPIGPPDVGARILAFTGAEGAYFYYIPTPPQVNGLLVGTASQINDNTTTQVLLDFGDPTLFAATGISTQGNNLANQIILDGSLGFGFYGSRLLTYGQRNTIQNLLNMGFDGGYLPSAPTQPTGWAYSGTGGGLETGHFGIGWELGSAALSQSMYEDYTGDPIANPNDTYTLRAWLSKAGTLTATISSASTGFSATATLTAVAAGWVQANFTEAMPTPIPSDLMLSIAGTSTLIVDDLTMIFTKSPYLNTMYASYINNPEGFDELSGVIGPVNDTHAILDIGIVRDNLQMFTQDPGGRLHETAQGITEPADWVVEEVASNCGVVSAFCLTRSQADDSTSVAGKDWGAWYSSTGIQIYGGSRPAKISQEIQRPKGQTFPGAPPDLNALNTSALLGVWGLNDPNQQIMYFGIPTGTATGPSVIWQLCYTGLDSADAIEGNPPIHKSLSGKLVATDLGRKWSPFQLTMNGAAQLIRSSGNLETCFFGGNGSAPNTLAGGYANAYTLNPQYFADDDYGLVSPFYVTYGFPDRDTEQQLQLGGGLKSLTYQQAFFFGVGIMNWSLYINSLGAAFIQNGLGTVQVNPWPLTGQYFMQASPPRNAEWPGGQAVGQRFFHKFASVPNPAGSTANPETDNAFSITVLGCGMRPNARGRVAGSYP